LLAQASEYAKEKKEVKHNSKFVRIKFRPTKRQENANLRLCTNHYLKSILKTFGLVKSSLKNGLTNL